MDFLRIIVAILLPLGVFLQVGIGKQFWINILHIHPAPPCRSTSRGVSGLRSHPCGSERDPMHDPDPYFRESTFYALG
jgi:hypothetical protein